jgi:hypothetical protein
MNIPLRLIAVLLAGLSLNAAAVSLTEITANGQTTRLYVQGDKGRIEGSGDSGYVLIDDRADTLIMVMPAQRKAMDMSRFLKNAASSPGPKTRFKPKGKGPTIAGYPPKRYDYSVAGEVCGTLYVSKKALADSGAVVLMQAMERMGAGRRALSMGEQNPCARGRGNVSKVIASLGLPMRIVDKTGRVDSEVTKVDTRATLPANAFEIPAGVKVQDAAKLQAMAQKYQPEIEAMMKKAEESGRLSPQMLEKMQRAKARYLNR